MKAVSLAGMVAVALVLLAVLPDTPRAGLERCWAELEAATPDASPGCFLALASGLSRDVAGVRSRDWTPGEKRRFERAFATRLRRELPPDVSATLRAEDSDGRGSRLVYRVVWGEAGANAGEATVLLAADGIPLDLLWNGGSIVRRYREECDRTLDRYSFAYLVGELEGSGVVVLEDFEDGGLGGLPGGWQERPFGERGAETKSPYRVLEENGNRFLRAEDRGENVMLYKEVRWDSRKYPYLSFRWRIRAVPAGSDERFESRADSAAGLYLSYGRRLGLVPESVKFVWSGALAAGTAFRRNGIGMPWTVVAGSGPADDSEWHRFVFDTGRVYRETFAGTPDERPLGIGLLTDANSTGGFASADYDDLVALARSSTEDRIRKIESVPAN
jgi:Protein of unknown function (DUF3047)